MDATDRYLFSLASGAMGVVLVLATRGHWLKGSESRLVRGGYWTMAAGFLLGSLANLIDSEVGFAAVVLSSIVGCAWMVLVVGALPLVAPRYAAKEIVYPMLHPLPWQPAPSIAEAERQTRRYRRGVVGVAVLGGAGYYVAARWLGVWVVFPAFILGLAAAVYHGFRRRPPLSKPE